MADGDRGKRKTPQEKKELSYEKDSVRIAEYPHALRKSLPTRKAASKREHRRKVNQALDAALGEANVGEHEDPNLEPAAVRRKEVRSWGSLSLRDSVEGRADGRASREGWNFFKKSYSSSIHREEFAAYLQSLVQGRSEESARLAQTYSLLLDPDSVRELSEIEAEEMTNLGREVLTSRCLWLRSFLNDEPRWEGLLQEWISKFRKP